MTKLPKIAMALAWLLGASRLNAAFDKGGVLGVGARPAGMGDAFVAIADDSNAPTWNPAGIVQLPRMELSGFFGPLLNGKEYYMSGSFVMPFMEQTAMGLTLVSLYHDTGSSDTDAYENQYLFTFATPLNVEKTVSFGLNVKFLQYESAAKATLPDGTVIDAQAGAIGLDLGVLYQVPLPDFGKKVNFGFFAQDLDTVLRWQSGVEETVPLLIQVGTAYYIEENLVASVDYSFFNDTNISGEALSTPLYDANGDTITTLNPDESRPHVGLEGWFFDGHLGLRTGYTGFATTPNVFTGGVSYRTANYGVDYAYMGHAEHLGDSHRLSAHYDFGAGGERPRVVALVNPPTNVGARPSNNAVQLSWDPNPDPHVTGYTLYMSRAPGGSYIPIQKRIKDNKVIIDGLTNGTRYYFVVTSVNNSWPSVESNYSVEVSAVPAPVIPTAPTMGQAQQQTGPVNNCVCNLQGWAIPAGNTMGYNIYMSETSGTGYKKVNDKPVTTLTYKVGNLECNRRYFFVLTGLTNDQPPVESKPSQEWSKNSEADSAAPGDPNAPAAH
jgi:hypothetical protein